MNLVPWRSKRRDNGGLPAPTTSPLLALRGEMDRLMDRFMREPLFGWGDEAIQQMGAWAPQLDVSETDKEVTIRAEVPGVDKKDLEVSVNEISVAIKGKVMREAKEEKGDYYRCEIGSGEFSRTIGLPCAVDASKASAQLKDGVLELTLPKIEKAKRHAIKID